jgi:hypothetical protein
VGAPAETRDTTELLVIWTHVSRGLAQTHAARTLYAVDAMGGGHSSQNIRKMSQNRFPGMATSVSWKVA